MPIFQSPFARVQHDVSDLQIGQQDFTEESGQVERDIVYNTAYVVDQGELSGKYRNTSLFQHGRASWAPLYRSREMDLSAIRSDDNTPAFKPGKADQGIPHNRK